MNKKEGDFANIMEELRRQKPLLARNYNVDYLGFSALLSAGSRCLGVISIF